MQKQQSEVTIFYIEDKEALIKNTCMICIRDHHSDHSLCRSHGRSLCSCLWKSDVKNPHRHLRHLHHLRRRRHHHHPHY